MSATNYRRYVKETLALARSMTVKSELSIIGINQYVEALGYSVSNDPHTWRYYLNLAGEPHFLDQPMEVVSLDSRETIPFTKEALEFHQVTKAHYQPGEWRYKELVERYPEQELLISGIVNPVDIDKAINARDFEILHYDTSLVESNETNLIDGLQQRINEFSIRWNNPSYAVHDDLYATAHLAVFYGRLPGWLMNIRLENCKTRYAHSFHIKEYLKSHGRLDRYYNYLTKAQALWLYRNLLYLERNAGKQENFIWLADNILTQRGMGLAEFNTHHNLDTLLDDLRPTPEFTRSALNEFHRSYRSEQHSFEELLQKQRPLARRNQEEEHETLLDDTRPLQNAKRNKLPTKALESSIIDWSESGVILRTQFLLNHWAYWGATGRYRAVIRVPHPRTGVQIEISVKDSFLLYLYSYNKSVGTTLSKIPGFTAQCIRRQPTPDFNTLRGLADKTLVDDAFIEHASKQRFSEHEIVSPYQFIDLSDELYRSYYDHREAYALRQDLRVRGQLQGVFDHLYMHVDTPFEDKGKAYTDWFVEKGLDVENLSRVEYETLTRALVEESTGILLDGALKPGAVQKAMIGIMSQLSSYNIHYIQEVNPGPILFWSWPATRVGEISGVGNAKQRTRLISHIPRDARFKGYQSVYLDAKRFVQQDHGMKGKLKVHQPVNVELHTRDFRTDFLRVPLARTRMDVGDLGCSQR